MTERISFCLFYITIRLDKTRFHVIGAILFTAQQGVLHPTAVVKTRMQVAEGGLSHMSGFSVFRRILRSDGIPGAFRGFGTSAVGALPGRVFALTSLEVSKEMAFKYSEHFDMSEASRIAVANGIAGLVSSIFSSAYFVPLDVVSIHFHSCAMFITSPFARNTLMFNNLLSLLKDLLYNDDFGSPNL